MFFITIAIQYAVYKLEGLGILWGLGWFILVVILFAMYREMKQVRKK